MPSTQEAINIFVQMNDYMNFRDVPFHAKGDYILGPAEHSI